MQELNSKVLLISGAYPTDGSFPYDSDWASAGSHGVTRDLIWKGETVAKADPRKFTYCCGWVFEIWFFAAYYEDLGTPEDVRKIRRDWFVATGKRKGPVDALVPRGLGIEIKGDEKGKPGDFAQLWRKSGSGHSVMVLEHTNDYLKYKSTQGSTNGIGVRTEFFKNVKNPITELYIARAISKPAPANG